MATVTSNTGVSYHVFSLRTSIKDFDEGIEFSELENDLGDNFFSQRLTGSNAGNRSWTISLPTLTATQDNLVVSVNGEMVSKAKYMWDLFCECKVTGKSFVIQDIENEQYYFCDFAMKKFTRKLMYAYLYSTGVELRQRRIPGETVFDVDGLSPLRWFNETSHGSGVWTDIGSDPGNFTATGDVVFSSNPQNGHNTVRLNNTTTTGILSAVGSEMRDIFIVLKIREATFPAASNVKVFGGASNDVLRGTASGTKFADMSISNFTYYKNGVEFADNDQQAPMSEFGIIHLQYLSPGEFSELFLQFGVNNATNRAKIDIAEVIGFSSLPTSDKRELMEHLLIKWL